VLLQQKIAFRGAWVLCGECSTQADRECLEKAMRDGKIVLPRAFYEVQAGRPVEYADCREVPGVLPAAASR
jgi:hypothetical protein